MSIDNKYIQEQINALVFSVTHIVNAVNGSLNTNGQLGSVVNNLYGAMADINKKCLANHLCIKPYSTHSRSTEAIFKEIKSLDLMDKLCEELHTALFGINSRNFKENATVRITKDLMISLSSDVNGLSLSALFSLNELIDDQMLVVMYGRLTGNVQRTVYNELGSMLNDFTKDPEEGILDTQTFNKEFEGMLRHSYSLEPYLSNVVVGLSDTSFMRASAKQLKSHDYYKINLPFDKYLQLVKDVEVIRAKYDDLIDTYCTQHTGEG